MTLKTMNTAKAMNTAVRMKAGVCALALMGALMAPISSAAASTIKSVSAKTVMQVKQSTQMQVKQSTQMQTAKKRKEIVEEAVASIDETRKALKALDNKNKKEALADLESATGKIEIVLARDPALKLAPVDVTAATSDIYDSVDDVNAAVDNARKLLYDGKVQDARHLLNYLTSESVITVTSIPLGAYPSDIKKAVALIDKGKTDEARALLQTTLNNLVVTQTVIPLPVARAEVMLKEAEVLAEKKARTKIENNHLSGLLNNAETQIRFAEALGYGQRADFEKFYDEISKIRERTSRGKSGMGFFDKIKEYMHSITAHSQVNDTGHKS